MVTTATVKAVQVKGGDCVDIGNGVQRVRSVRRSFMMPSTVIVTLDSGQCIYFDDDDTVTKVLGA